MGRATNQPPGPPAYRNEPDHAEIASMASAVLLDDVEAYLDEELPSYTDTPSQSSYTPTIPRNIDSDRDPHNAYYMYVFLSPESSLLTSSRPPTEPPFSTHDLMLTEYRTRFPNYSTDAAHLEAFIKEQLAFPASYFVRLCGTHTETRRNGTKETEDKITDFYIRINITYLLGRPGSGEVEFLPDNKRGYRGTIVPRLKPNTPITLDEEVSQNNNELSIWCRKYVSDPSSIKSFTLKREILNHDTKKIEQLLRSAIAETNYRGHLSIDFPKQHERVVIYSPAMINHWRMTVWIRWVFYLTFLWVFTWPVLFFLTSRYEVVKGIYKYADSPSGNDMTRKCTVMTEVQWFHRWESAIKRAALARMNNKDACLDEEYREATARADQRGETVGRTPEIPRTGNAFADGALGLLGQGLRVAEGFQSAREWGGDC
jgi:hypothetical protein